MDEEEKRQLGRQMLVKHGYSDEEIAKILDHAFGEKADEAIDDSQD